MRDPVAAAVASAVVATLLVHGAPRLVARLRARRGPKRMTDCSACHRPLDARKAVQRASVIDMPDGIGGTAMVAEYHRRCAPHP